MEKEQQAGFWFIAISILIPVLLGILVYQRIGGWTGPLLITAIFWLLYALARNKNWTSASPLRVVRSRRVSELYLSLALMASALVVSWAGGLFISRAFLEMDGILLSLCLFGVLMLAISACRDWE